MYIVVFGGYCSSKNETSIPTARAHDIPPEVAREIGLVRLRLEKHERFDGATDVLLNFS